MITKIGRKTDTNRERFKDMPSGRINRRARELREGEEV